MKNTLHHITLQNFKIHSGKVYDIPLSYQIFGCQFGEAPVVLVNHALTGNSDVAGENGWWKTLIGTEKTIDLDHFSVLCFNIPGNGFDDFLMDDFQEFKTIDIARIFLEGLNQLHILKLFAIIGGSVGGAIGWEMLCLKPDLAEKFIPIATDFKTTDWLHSQCLVQDFLLDHQDKPLEKARIHAMLCYRTPESLNVRFQRNFDEEKQILESHDWLNFHGKKLDERFSLKAYRLMNQLLKTIDADVSKLNQIQSEIHLIAVDSDLFFPAFEIKKCNEMLLKAQHGKENTNVFYHEINSIHGHDAFLMEYEQLNPILKPIFMNKKNKVKLLKNRSIIRFEGKNFLGEVGVDGRIFKALTLARISVGVISQQAVENGISILVSENDAEKAVNCLIDEFQKERQSGKMSMIYSINNVSVLGFVTDDYGKISKELERNNIFPLILNQIASEKRVNLVVTSSQDEKAKNIIEAEIFGKPKTVHLAIIGHGNVGNTLIEQVFSSSEEIKRRKKLDLKIIGIANSKKLVLDKNGLKENWKNDLETSTFSDVQELINFSKTNQLENLIAVDNTASRDFVANYPILAENGFDIVSSNKIFNTLPISQYRDFRNILTKNNKKYLYETNVGAGLPLIDTIKLLHLSGENITRIKGVFSGSLSYIFNNFSVRDEKFSTIVREAMKKSFTEPDPREDLSGNDVARKLLILARELDLINEFDDINIQNLIPKNLQKLEESVFVNQLEDLDEEFQKIKNNQEPNHVLRYIGDLHGDLQKEKGELDVKLISVPESSALGQLKGSDSIFEIYTESYGENPIVIMGAGAGAKVTARGVFGDILRLSETK